MWPKAARRGATRRWTPIATSVLYGAIAYTILGDKADAVRLLKLHFAVNPQKVEGFRLGPGLAVSRTSRTIRAFRQLVGK